MHTLFHYQMTGAKWLAGKAQAFLADDMGVGKTPQAVHGADRAAAWNILVVCPAVARVNWEREFERFSPLDRPCRVLYTAEDPLPAEGVVVCSYDLLAMPSPKGQMKRAVEAHEAAVALAGIAAAINGADLGPATAVYEAVLAMDRALKLIARAKKARALEAQRKSFLAALKARSWDLVILDEAHYLKERASDRSQAIYGSGPAHPGIAKSAARVWRLSGTPAPNDASELWTHLHSAGATRLPYWDFLFRYCATVETERDYKVVGHKNVDELKALMAPLFLRRKKEEVLKDLPPIVFHEVVVERSKVDVSDPIFEDVRNGESPAAFLARILAQEASVAAAAATRTPEELLAYLEASQTALAAMRRYTAMAKLPAVLDIIEAELDAGEVDKIVIFAVHQCVVEAAQKRLARFGASAIYGKTGRTRRQANIDGFQTDPAQRVVVCNIGAAGTAITLTAACEVVFLEQDWVPANNSQAAARCHRVTQTRAVRGRVFSLYGSVDERVQAAVTRKTKEIAKFI